ncbi:MAG: nitroreductase family protein [Deltaproteobacteria bacterium]|jgi:nitroreductase|nr:nitroreductase family protein [Deltaproteobacteria bacterium]
MQRLMRRRFFTSILTALLGMFVLVSGAAYAQDITLPEPQTTGGLGIFDALKKRASVSGGDFSAAEVTLEELSTVLWAASGLNRGTTGWTVPMAEGLPPYVKIFVAGPQGVFRYSWEEHKLIEISKDNVKDKIGHQTFVKKAYYILIFASDSEISSQLKRGKAHVGDFTQVLVGAMTQNIYLAAGGLNLGTRYIHRMNVDDVVQAVGLTSPDYPIALMLLGK